MIKTSVVILNWNGEHYLRKFIPLLLSRTYAPNTEFVVVDNASTDGSIEYLQELKEKVKLIRFDENHGFAKGYAIALEQIEAEYVVLLNSDVEVGEQWLMPLINKMDNEPSLAACMPKIRSYSQKEFFEYAGACGGFIDYLGYPFCRGRILNLVEEDRGQYNTAIPVFWATGACMMLRKKAYDAVGGLEPLFIAHMEEIDLCWRFKNAGYEILVEPQSVVYHIGGGTLPNNSPRKIFLNFRNNLLMMARNLHPDEKNIILLKRMMLDGIAALKFLQEGKWQFFVQVFNAHIEFYKLRKEIKRYRKGKSFNKLSQIDGVFKASLLKNRFIRGRKKFSELDFISA